MRVFIALGLAVSQGWATPAPFSALDVAKALKVHLQDKVNFSGDFDVSLTSNQLSIPHDQEDDKLVLEEVQFNQDQKSFQALMAIANADNKTRLKVIAGKVEPLTEVPMLTRAIGPGEVIEEADITWQKLPSGRLSQNFILKKEDIIGQTAKNRILQPGLPVSRYDVRAPIVIKRGDPVTIAYRTENMLLTTTATAERDAASGEVARFKIGKNNKVIQARVLGPNKAEIRPVEF
ncbi:flagellar basal body P-ring formation chaperone FlgA [Candidatus Odyssella thessalonicensis]|uniref:flagellar basal body P-ring formation chaperone FlgA n=1 Tax=Candidatus Odyssella thessalonicensis TaxID=84647 RepID=UPI000225AEFF|nr:flagellar basal body P-ring formation chaperone FlgA [Candidatus Odyssella thessalonicensis]